MEKAFPIADRKRRRFLEVEGAEADPLTAGAAQDNAAFLEEVRKKMLLTQLVQKRRIKLPSFRRHRAPARLRFRL